MSVPMGKHAVVVGAGMGGLAAAKALSAHFERVTVLERDALPQAPAPRQGTPQGRHAHVLLAGGRRALTTLFPPLEQELEQAGAIRIRVGHDVIWSVRAMTPIRDAILASPRSACRVPSSNSSFDGGWSRNET